MLCITDSLSDMPLQTDLKNLPDDLKGIVMDDNKAFSQEMLDWDEQQTRSVTTPTAGNLGEGDGNTKQEKSSVKSIFLLSIYLKIKLNTVNFFNTITCQSTGILCFQFFNIINT